MALRIAVVTLVVALAFTCSLFAAPVAVPEDEARLWIQHTLPLPHEMAIPNAVTLLPKDVGLRVPPDAGEIVKQAESELRALFTDKAGVAPDGKTFEILLGRLTDKGELLGVKVEGADRLKELPNRAQAYVIRPVGDRQLLVAALDERGAYYGALTLAQLLGAYMTKEQVRVPLAVVTDWPDMDERGTWNTGYSTPGFVPWMASLKINFTHIPMSLILKPDGVALCPPLPVDLMAQARTRAFNLMPHAPHFDYWYRYNVEKLYPDLVGQGEGARNPMHAIYPSVEKFQRARCPCASNPTLTKLVTGWILSAAEQGAREISIWLTEFVPCQCACERCMRDGPRQLQLETQATIAAIDEARKKYPDLVGRIFFTLDNKPKAVADSAECLALVPPHIKAEKMYGQNKAFDDYAARGNWLATYSGPGLRPGSYMRYAHAADMLRYVQRYLGAGYSAFYCIGGLGAAENLKGDWEHGFGDYQYSALAEWTWNLKGRSTREFAEAWATRQGLANPQKFGEWLEVIEPADIQVDYDTRNRLSAWIATAAALGKKESTDAWVSKMPTRETMDNMIAACERALPLAEQSGDAAAVLETRFIHTWLKAQLRFADLCDRMARNDRTQPMNVEKIQAVAKAFDADIAALSEFMDALMNTPSVNPKAGPEMIRARFAAWAKDLRERTSTSIAKP